VQEIVFYMPRPLIGTPKIDGAVSAKAQPRSSLHAGLREPQLGKRLREKRSIAYVEAIKKIDAGSYQSNQAALESLIQAISNEFPELGIGQLPLGIVSRCYLGSPFEVHICDLNGEIIEHFETYRSMSAPFERARSLALHPAYAFIEVFSDTLRAITTDGSVSVVGQ
jgi:hypothetical protein